MPEVSRKGSYELRAARRRRTPSATRPPRSTPTRRLTCSRRSRGCSPASSRPSDGVRLGGVAASTVVSARARGCPGRWRRAAASARSSCSRRRGALSRRDGSLGPERERVRGRRRSVGALRVERAREHVEPPLAVGLVARGSRDPRRVVLHEEAHRGDRLPGHHANRHLERGARGAQLQLPSGPGGRRLEQLAVLVVLDDGRRAPLGRGVRRAAATSQRRAGRRSVANLPDHLSARELDNLVRLFNLERLPRPRRNALNGAVEEGNHLGLLREGDGHGGGRHLPIRIGERHLRGSLLQRLDSRVRRAARHGDTGVDRPQHVGRLDRETRRARSRRAGRRSAGGCPPSDRVDRNRR